MSVLYIAIPYVAISVSASFLLTIQQRIRYKVAVITYKALSTSVPPYLDELLQRQETMRSRRSNDALRLIVPRTRTETSKRAFSVAAPNVWNSLPIDIRNSNNSVDLS